MASDLDLQFLHLRVYQLGFLEAAKARYVEENSSASLAQFQFMTPVKDASTHH